MFNGSHEVTTLSCHWCKDWSGGDTIFDHITALHEGQPLGRVLEIGDGVAPRLDEEGGGGVAVGIELLLVDWERSAGGSPGLGRPVPGD